MALIASSDPSTTAYTSVELTPYNSGESPAQQHPSAELWYDSMIVSTARIGDSERQG